MEGLRNVIFDIAGQTELNRVKEEKRKMKEKIFQLLKQAYSPLGLGDVILQAHAEALDALGFVTDENVNDVVAKQKTFLEGLQKGNDRRVTEAVNKALAEVKKQTPEIKPEKQEESEEAKAIRELRETVSLLQKENSEAKAAEARRTHEAKILSKAKALGIPQYRIDEGFNIGQDADDAAIDSYLSKGSQNIKDNRLPDRGGRALADAAPDKAQTDALAAKLVGKL